MKYNLIFSGKNYDSHTPEEVQQNLKNALKLNNNQLARIFNGNPITLKKNIPQEAAQKLEAQLRKMGAITTIESATINPALTTNTPEAPQTIILSEPVKKPIELALEDVEPAKSENTTTEAHSYTDEVPATDSEEDEDGNTRQLSIAGLILIALGIVFIFTFSPTPGFTIRYGFIIGLILVGLGAKKMSNAQ